MFLAQAWGLYLILISLALLINKEGVRSLLGTMDTNGAVVMSGALSLIIGVLSVVAHNEWSGPAYVIVVTIFGWLALLKGFVRMTWPARTRKMVSSITDGGYVNVLLIICLLIGIYLAYMGQLV